jgi:hypothetical protein
MALWRYRHNGTQKMIGFGAFPEVSLAKNREAAPQDRGGG